MLAYGGAYHTMDVLGEPSINLEKGDTGVMVGHPIHSLEEEKKKVRQSSNN
jgi:hypothetical protein